jgi:hypothetical protein
LTQGCSASREEVDFIPNFFTWFNLFGYFQRAQFQNRQLIALLTRSCLPLYNPQVGDYGQSNAENLPVAELGYSL